MMVTRQMTDTPEWAVIEAGQFIMGNNNPDHGEDGEHPQRPVELDRYQLSITTITNAMFARFVAVTGYQTLAEKQGFSHVFKGQLDCADDHPIAAPLAPWWRHVKRACWQFPNGTIPCVDELPVVHIAYEDALSYCGWAGCRLPTEAEWEYAASAGEELSRISGAAAFLTSLKACRHQKLLMKGWQMSSGFTICVVMFGNGPRTGSRDCIHLG